MAYTAKLVDGDRTIEAFVDDGLRTPLSGERLVILDPATGQRRELIAGDTPWYGSRYMAPPQGAVRVNFTTDLQSQG